MFTSCEMQIGIIDVARTLASVWPAHEKYAYGA